MFFYLCNSYQTHLLSIAMPLGRIKWFLILLPSLFNLPMMSFSFIQEHKEYKKRNFPLVKEIVTHANWQKRSKDFLKTQKPLDYRTILRALHQQVIPVLLYQNIVDAGAQCVHQRTLYELEMISHRKINLRSASLKVSNSFKSQYRVWPVTYNDQVWLPFS